MMFSTPAERHIFLIGFFETACPWKPRESMPARYPWPVKAEYHYYLGGRWIGLIALSTHIVLLFILIWEVIT